MDSTPVTSGNLATAFQAMTRDQWRPWPPPPTRSHARPAGELQAWWLWLRGGHHTNLDRPSPWTVQEASSFLLDHLLQQRYLRGREDDDGWRWRHGKP